MQRSGNALRVLIVDDHPAIREGLTAAISRQPDFVVCGEAGDTPEALKLVESLRPDVAVIDIALKSGSGIDLVKRIKARNDSIRVLVWSMYDDSLYADRALRAGARGYINKGETTGKVVEAIRCIVGGRIYLGEEISGRMLAGAARLPIESLSNRELEAFKLIGEGLTTRQISERLHVSVHTVDTHRQRIKAKLHLTTSAEVARAATQWVLENG